MNLYASLMSGLGTNEVIGLIARLSEWHDEMVTHERRLRAGSRRDACDDDCPHAEARTLWTKAMALFGTRAHEMTFLRARAEQAIGAHRHAQVRGRATLGRGP